MQLHSSLTTTQHGGDWSATHPRRLEMGRWQAFLSARIGLVFLCVCPSSHVAFLPIVRPQGALCSNLLISFTMAQEPPVGQGLLIIEDSRSHSDTPHSVGLLWTSNQPDAEASTWHTQHSQQTNVHAPDGIRNHNPSYRAVAAPRLRPLGHWDRQSTDRVIMTN